ncbi:extracellular solute-binding protein [Microbispora sp. NPDC049125]|uniref:extracellular solute-binding protein n=1 Tax=Microbispora sp. NPDC049125 TaxID=3154929 RepID=UPI0034669BCB
MGVSRRHLAVAAAGLLAAACAGPGQTGGGGTGGGTAGAAFTPSGSASASALASSGVPVTPASPASSAPTAATPGTGSPAPSPIASAGRGEGAVSVMALNGYAEWGGVDPKVKWVGTFEQDTGCKVSLRYYDPAQPEKPGDFDPSSFDVVSATPVVGGRLIDERKVAPLNTELLGDYDQIPARLRDLPSVTRDDQVYGVPYLWGTNEVLYDSGKVRPGGPEAIFTDKGPVMFRDSPLTLADAALVLKGRGADIKDPFDLTPAQLAAAAALFEPGTPGRRLYWSNPIEVVQGFAARTVRLAQGTPYHLDVLKRGHRPVKAVGDRPVTGWADSWMVSSSAAHPSCAYQWLDYTSTADVQRKASAWMGFAPANPGACTGRARRICADYHVGEARAFKGVVFATRPPGYDQWIDRWSRIAPR